jgi:hypothetical protein
MPGAVFVGRITAVDPVRRLGAQLEQTDVGVVVVQSLADVNIVAPVVLTVTYVLLGVTLLTEAVALVHSITQRAEAYTAAGKLTKPSWVGINLAAILVTLLFGALTSNPLGLIAIIAALVYIVDVRPALREVSEGGSSSW